MNTNTDQHTPPPSDSDMVIAEYARINAETRKLIAESDKIHKKARWHEVVIFTAAIAATIAFTKLFL